MNQEKGGENSEGRVYKKRRFTLNSEVERSMKGMKEKHLPISQWSVQKMLIKEKEQNINMFQLRRNLEDGDFKK